MSEGDFFWNLTERDGKIIAVFNQKEISPRLAQWIKEHPIKKELPTSESEGFAGKRVFLKHEAMFEALKRTGWVPSLSQEGDDDDY